MNPWRELLEFLSVRWIFRMLGTVCPDENVVNWSREEDKETSSSCQGNEETGILLGPGSLLHAIRPVLLRWRSVTAFVHNSLVFQFRILLHVRPIQINSRTAEGYLVVLQAALTHRLQDLHTGTLLIIVLWEMTNTRLRKILRDSLWFIRWLTLQTSLNLTRSHLARIFGLCRHK